MNDQSRRGGDEQIVHFPSLEEQERGQSFEKEDKRWASRMQVRDWLVLAGLFLLTIGWGLLAFIFEPGLR